MTSLMLAFGMAGCTYFDLGKPIDEGQGQPSHGVLTVKGLKDGSHYEAEVYDYPDDDVTDAADLAELMSQFELAAIGLGTAGNGTLELTLLVPPEGEYFTADGDFFVVLKVAKNNSAPLIYKAAVPFTGGSATVEYDDMETAIRSYVVTFDLNYTDAANPPNPHEIDAGGKVTPPAAPVRTGGYTFGGWFLDEAGTTKWDFDSPVTADLTLYAKWMREVWRWSKSTAWKVTDGIAASVYYEQVPEYTSYVDEGHYEYKYSFKLSDSTTLNEVEISQNGLEFQIRQVNKTDDSSYEHKSITDYVYDADSELIQQKIVNTTVTQNGTTTSSRTEQFYTITLQSSNANGEKTYKTYITSTGANGAYELYTIKDGVTLSMSSYDDDGVLYYIRTTEFPSDPVIRERLPTLTLSRYTYASTPSSDYHQTCELLASSDSSLTVSEKVFNSSSILMSQTDNTYTKITLP
jgi:uncharacterized repeat protein (TIGR02543 family)